MYRIWKVKRPIKRPRHRQAAGNINMNLKEIGLEGLEGFTWLRIQTSGWAFVSMKMKFQVPYNERNFLPEEQLATQDGPYCMEFLIIHSVNHSPSVGL
jgi:hypothetical protein